MSNMSGSSVTSYLSHLMLRYILHFSTHHQKWTNMVVVVKVVKVVLVVVGASKVRKCSGAPSGYKEQATTGTARWPSLSLENSTLAARDVSGYSVIFHSFFLNLPIVVDPNSSVILLSSSIFSSNSCSSIS